MITFHGSNYRVKRALINAIGSVANTLFSVLDQNFAETYERQINTLKSDESYLLELIKNQTSIEDSTINLFKRSEEEMRTHVHKMGEYLSNYSNRTNKVLSEHEEKSR